jgi:NAD(P)-dependent dehydrogenase (short-subunit alcohol dehydrogenase family)
VPRHRSGANATISSERTPAARSCRRIAQTPTGRTDRFARNPLKRIGQHEEVAAVILGLATTMTFVNGTIIPVDGGSLF